MVPSPLSFPRKAGIPAVQELSPIHSPSAYDNLAGSRCDHATSSSGRFQSSASAASDSRAVSATSGSESSNMTTSAWHCERQVHRFHQTDSPRSGLS